MKPRRLLSSRSFALRVGLSHWGLTVALQLSSWFQGVFSTGTWDSTLSHVILLQPQNLACAVVLSIIAYAFAAQQAGRWFSVTLALLFNVAVLADQVYFRIAHQHFRPSAVEGVQTFQPALWSSLRYELASVFAANAVLTVVVALWLLRQPSRTIGGKLPGNLAAPSLAVVVGASGLCLAAYQVSTTVNNEAALHPLFALFDDGAPVQDRDPGGNEESFTAMLASPSSPPDDRFTRLQARLNSLKPKPNIILVILESVGAKQLLTDNGLPSPTLTPHLSRMANQSVVFDALYSVFPGTVRSHVAINTGGLTLTWGNVFYELSYPYFGPTLAGSLGSFGYETALFASQRLDFENMEGFYSQAGYDTVFDFGKEPSDVQKAQGLSSWGGREEYTLSKLEQWLTQSRDRDKPFLITYLTVATHHPYDYPNDLPNLVPGDDRQIRYENALRYTDHTLGALTSLLQREGLSDTTIVAVTGDHGQAFGDLHVGNLIHKHFLYDENVRNFLLLHNPTAFLDSIRSSRVGSIGDIMPTILDAIGAPPPHVPGLSLLEPERGDRPAMFSKNAHPAQWGLRYQNWKYIARMSGDEPELYDVSTDPEERHNRVAEFPELVALYQRVVERWYFQTNDAFVANLKGYTIPGGRRLKPSDIETAGPKLLAVGHGKSGGGYRAVEFQVATTLHPRESVVAWTQWHPYTEVRDIRFQWRAPSGANHHYTLSVEPGWLLSYIGYEGPTPMEEGSWRLTLTDPSDERILVETSFIVDQQSALHLPADASPRPLESAVGYRPDAKAGESSKLQPSSTLDPNVAPTFWTRWAPAPRSKRVWVSWQSPRGPESEGYFDVRQGWDQTWINYDGAKPLTPGTWTVTIADDLKRSILTTASFQVVVRPIEGYPIHPQ